MPNVQQPTPYPIRVPHLGERRDVASHEVPLGALVQIQNMFRGNNGRIAVRPGYSTLAATGPGGRIMGLKYFRTAAGADRLVAANRTQLWKFDGTSWSNITGGTALAGSTTQQVRFAVMSVSGTYKIAAVNGAQANQLWDGAAPTFANQGGSPPNALDACVGANRMLLVVSPDNIRISEFNDPETWPSDLTVRLVDAGDLLVGCERLNRTAVAIYGDRSQWLARAQPGSFPFRFDLIDEQPGPLSPYSVVRYGSVHYYLAEDNDVYRFDGISARSVGGQMRRYVLDNINHSNRAMSHGWYSYSQRKINWLFPDGANTAPGLGIWLDPITNEMGELKYGSAITASSTWRTVTLVNWNGLTGTWDNLSVSYPTWDSFGGAAQMREILGDTSGQIHVTGLGDGSDNGGAIECIIELPLISGDPAAYTKAIRPSTFETWWRKTANSTTLQSWVGSTNTLMSDRTLTALPDKDLNTDQRNDLNLALLDAEYRFMTIRHRVSATKGEAAWMGGILYGYPQDVAKGPTS